MAVDPSSLTPAGLVDTLYAAGLVFEVAPSGVRFATPAIEAAAQSIINAYAGSAAQLAWTKAQKQALLDDQFNQHFDLPAFIRGGSATGITANQVGTFLATITNNYRSLRASIAAATTVAQVNAINIAAGWPANP